MDTYWIFSYFTSSIYDENDPSFDFMLAIIVLKIVSEVKIL